MKISPTLFLAVLVFGACWVCAPLIAMWGVYGVIASAFLAGGWIYYASRKV